MLICDCQCFFYMFPEKFLFVDILPIPYGEFSPYFKRRDNPVEQFHRETPIVVVSQP